MSFVCILILMAITLNEATLSMGASDSSKSLTTLGRNTLLKKSNDKKIEYITFADQSRLRKGNQVAIINQLLPIANKLASMKEFVISEQMLEMLNIIFNAITSVLFGPHADIYWPFFTNILLNFLKLLM